MTFKFIIECVLFGIALSMDACAVSMTNGLKFSKMGVRHIILISLSFGLFQGIMPMLGYLVSSAFVKFIEMFVPWIALGILGFLGIRMIVGAVKHKDNDEGKNEKQEKLTFGLVMVQSFATSIDALSVGLSIANYTLLQAIICTCSVALITFAICVASHFIGRKFGDKLGNKAEIIGGVILIIIGLEIFITNII